MPIHIPPLRKRKEDIQFLCERLIRKINQDYGRNVEGVSEGAIKKLMEYDWPGNVRELENILGRAIIFLNYSETIIQIEHLPELQNGQMRDQDEETGYHSIHTETLAAQLERYEAKVIKSTLRAVKGNKTAASKSLGVSVRNLYYKLEKYGIETNDMQ